MAKKRSTSDNQIPERQFELIPAPAPAELSSASASPAVEFGGQDAAAGGDMGRYVHALRRRWLMALLVALPLAAIVSYAVWTILPKLYTSTAILRLAGAESMLLFHTADHNGNSGGNTFESYKRTQRQLVLSRFVVTRALRDDVLAAVPVIQGHPDPAEWLETNLAVSFPDESELMHVSLTAEKPEGLHLLVNGVVKGYFDEVVNAERKRKSERLISLETAYRKADSELRLKRNDLKQLVERVGTGDSSALTIVQQNSLQQYAAFQQRYTSLRFDLMQAEGELELSEATANAQDDAEISIPDHELLLAMRTDRESERLKTEKHQALELIKTIKERLKAGAADQRVDEFDRRLKICDDKIEARKTELRKELIEHKRVSAAGGMGAIKRRIALLTAQEKQMQKKSHELEAEAKQLGRSSIDVEIMRAEIAALQDISKSLNSELERTKVELQSADASGSSTRVSLLGDAREARLASSKSRMTKAIGAGVAGLLLPILFVVWLDARKDRVNSGAEIIQTLGLSVIGSVPLVPQRVMQRLNGPSAKHQYWRTLLSESVDSIAAVLLCGAQQEIRVAMVSSATAGEGKTTLAANLATSLAGAGCRTILVDFDLRRPALHRVLGLSLQPGINDVLRDPSALDGAVQMSQIPNLAFLSAGRWSSTGLASLAAADLKSLFDRLRAEYEFVVVDGSPILPVVDTRIIAQNVDTVILSVLRDVSRVPQVGAACDLLGRFAIPIFGVVVTGSKGDAYPDSNYEPLTETQAV